MLVAARLLPNGRECTLPAAFSALPVCQSQMGLLVCCGGTIVAASRCELDHNFDIAQEADVTFDENEVELRVGEAVWVGHYRVTVIEVDGREVVVQVEESTGEETSTPVGRPR